MKGVSEAIALDRESEGLPAVPLVLFIKQIHDRPELGPLLKWEVARYQGRLLNFLIARRPLHVFVESLTEDLAPHHPERRGLRRDLARRAFGSGQCPENPDSMQRHLLIEMGAAFIYAALYEGVILHKTSTPEELRDVEAKVARDGLQAHWDLVTRGREKMAAREISDFLEKRPASEAVLVFGAFHDFSDDFDPAQVRMESLDFFEK